MRGRCCHASLTIVVRRRCDNLLPNTPPRAPVEQRRNNLVFHSLSADHVKRVRAKCKAAGTTVHGILMACQAMAAREVWALRTGQRDISVWYNGSAAGSASCFLQPVYRLDIGQPVSMRKFAGFTDDDICCAIGGVGTPQYLEPNQNVWDLARKCKRDLTKALAAQASFSCWSRYQLSTCHNRFTWSQQLAVRWLASLTRPGCFVWLRFLAIMADHGR